MIIFEKPILSAMELGTQYKKCCNCLLKNQLNLIPCLRTASLMFCSINCRDEIYRKFISDNFDCLISGDNYGVFRKILLSYVNAFGGEESLRRFVLGNDIKKWNKTVFDFDFSNLSDDDYNQIALMSIFSYYPVAHYKGLKEYRKEIVEKATKGDKIFMEFLSHMGNKNLIFFNLNETIKLILISKV
jgi:hypothetical protein